MTSTADSRAPDRTYTWRPPTLADAAGASTLWRTCDEHDFGSGVINETDALQEWDHPGFDLSTDSMLAEAADGTVAAYAQVQWRGDDLDGFGVVHPDHRGRGLGTACLAFTEGRAGELMAERGAARAAFRQFVSGKDEGGQEMLAAAGYSPVRRFWDMEGELTPENDHVVAPVEGIVVREFVRGVDERIAYEVDEEAFAEHWGHVRHPYEAWLRRLELPGYDPSLTLLAEDDGKVVGVLIGDVREDLGWVDTLGVLKEWRGRGIGDLLLRTEFAEFRRRGLTRVGLGVDSSNATGATRLYERVGLRPVRFFDVLERVLELHPA